MNSNLVQAALYARLNGQATTLGLTGGVHYRLAPMDATTPFVVFSKQSGVPLQRGLGGDVAADNLVYLVKVIDEGESNLRAAAIMADVNAILDNRPLAVTGHNNVLLQRISDVELDETDSGQTWQHVGAEYRLIVV
jgi:hypothetical protein